MFGAVIQMHQFRIQGRLNHITDLPLGLSNQDLQWQFRNRIAAFLFQHEVAYLRTVAMGDDDPVCSGQFCNLSNGIF
jgi:hypothetical protein